MPSQPARILFVCLGNICRSPLAECVFRQLAQERGVAHRFEVDSAGTSGYHNGAPPDRRSAATAAARGLVLSGASRKLTAADLASFDLVVAMDAENVADIEALRAEVGGAAPVRRLREWDPAPSGLDVPDPYYGGARGFDDVHDIVERSCAALLDQLLAEPTRE